MRADPDGPVEVTPLDANVRTLVHEYGGGSWWLHADTLFWVDVADQRLRATDAGGTRFVTADPPIPRGLRYADGDVTPDGRFSVCVRERHDGSGEPANEIVAVANDGSAVEVVWSGADFVSSPRVSPDGRRVAFVSWDHPEMPWTRTRLHVYEFDDGRGGAELLRLDGDRAFCEPGWVGDTLHVVVDDDEWWNLFAVDLDAGSLTGVVTGPFEIATPPWVFGMQRWAEVDGRVVAVAALPT
ncbi:MAG: S9 family peptidase, partial [Actinomycetota bacterium]